MSTWTDIRDFTTSAAISPYAAQAYLFSGDSGSDIPGVDQMQDLWHGVSGQTAADAAREAARAQSQGIEYAADIQREMFEQSRLDQMPWLRSGEWALGQLQDMMGNAPTFEDYQQSDYSKFIQQQGLDAIAAKSRAGGYYNTGATSKEMMQYAQDIAGQDYQQYLSNYYQSLNPYMSMAGLGQQQSQALAGQSSQAASNLGQSAVGAANAYAQGITGAANAQTAGMQNLLNLGAYMYGVS